MSPITQIPPEPSGTAKETTWFRQMLRCIRERTVKVGPGLRASYLTDGTLIELAAIQEQTISTPGASIQQYRITAIADDYLEANTWDGTMLGSAAVRIAKPWRLRRAGWDGMTVTYDFNGAAVQLRYAYSNRPGYRTATHTSLLTVENQAIIPVYSINDVLYATEPEGGTFLTVAGAGLTWLDLNVDARAWARY